MKHVSDYLLEERKTFRKMYLSSNIQERQYLKSRFKEYEWQFKSQKEFLRWFLWIVN